MKKFAAICIGVLGLYSCSKEESLAKHDTYKEVIYRIQTSDSNLLVNLMRAVVSEEKTGNIGKDTVLVDTGLYNIPATVLTGVHVTLFAMSTESPNFDLKIMDKQGNILAQTDTITHYPANPAHPEDQYISKISFLP